MKPSAIPYEQWALRYLSNHCIDVDCHSYEYMDAVEMIEDYIEEM